MTLDRTKADLLCEKVAETYDPEEIVDLLGLNSEELVEELRNVIIDKADMWEQYLDLEDE
jgi:hypothetical protein